MAKIKKKDLIKQIDLLKEKVVLLEAKTTLLERYKMVNELKDKLPNLPPVKRFDDQKKIVDLAKKYQDREEVLKGVEVRDDNPHDIQPIIVFKGSSIYPLNEFKPVQVTNKWL